MCFIVKWRMCNPNLLDLTKGLKKYLLKHHYILQYIYTRVTHYFKKNYTDTQYVLQKPDYYYEKII